MSAYPSASGPLTTLIRKAYCLMSAMPPAPHKRSTASKKKATAPPPVRQTAIERVAQRLEELLRTGELKRGSRLPSEPTLAKLLGVSRASLREATKGLVFLGLLRARAGDGTYLQPSLSSMVTRHLQWMVLLEEVKYLELYELRQILEPVVAQLAARRATPDDLELMRTALAGMRKSVRNPEAFVRHELEFHNAITGAAKNRAIESMMHMMYGALAEGRSRVLPLVDDLERHCKSHAHIYDLIANGEATLARRAISADLRYAESLLELSLGAPAHVLPPHIPIGPRGRTPRSPHASSLLAAQKPKAGGKARPARKR